MQGNINNINIRKAASDCVGTKHICFMHSLFEYSKRTKRPSMLLREGKLDKKKAQ